MNSTIISQEETATPPSPAGEETPPETPSTGGEGEGDAANEGGDTPEGTPSEGDSPSEDTSSSD